MTVEVRYFAGIAERAGKSGEAFDNVPSLADLERQIVGRHGEAMASGLAVCSFLIDGRSTTDRQAAVPSGSQVDVLPPFAGG